MTPCSVIAGDLPAKAWLACWSHKASRQAGAKQSLWKEVRI
jgi:hypothetical protein